MELMCTHFSDTKLNSLFLTFCKCHTSPSLVLLLFIRKNLEMHIETGHSTFESGPTHQKDLRCPFCLYQTKNKNNMIDHIILHRGELGSGQDSVPHLLFVTLYSVFFSLLLSEERVVPIEVRRPKLSRYLQGIVFRCHKCTFTSASAENLHLHMKRHDDIKPYKCRLCYFDCSQLCNLEAHLCDKHQVSISNQPLYALLEFLCVRRNDTSTSSVADVTISHIKIVLH